VSDDSELEKQFDEKWAEVLQIFEKAKMHPICPKILLMFHTDDGNALRQEWTKPMVESFWVYMEEAHAAKTHKKAVDDLIRIAHYVNTKMNNIMMATGLLVLLNECVLKYKLVNLDVNAKFEAEDDVSATAAVTGGKARPVPAKVGQRMPDGAGRPDQLAGNKRKI